MNFRNIGENTPIENAECIITKRKKHRGQFSYLVTDGEGELEFESGKFMQVGNELRISGTVERQYGFLQITKPRIEPAEGIYAGILAKVEENVKVVDVPFLVSGEIMDKLRPEIMLCAKKILTAKKMGRHARLRFHSDADGITGALAITKMLKRAYTHQQNSATYSVYDSMRDIGNLQSEKSPLVILLDFACGAESAEGLKLLKASGAEIIIIDHHPNEGNAGENCSLLVSPWTISNQETASSYVAGYLAVEIARACGEENTAELAPIACAGDKSTILPVSEKDKEMAIVLDYMATYSGFGNKLDFYKNALENKELYYSVLVQAKESLDRITDEVKAHMKKRYDGEVSVYTIDTERVKSKEFPGKGKITTRGFELVEDPAVVLGVWKNGLSFRITDGAIKKGIKANEIISALKEEMPDFIEGGGGHARAASLRIREGFVDSVVEKIIEKVKAA